MWTAADWSLPIRYPAIRLGCGDRMQFDQLKRREFITLLGGATAAWPLTVRAQQGERMRRVGVLMGVADDAEGQARIKGLQQGLRELGWIEGRNVHIDYRWTGGDATRVRAYAAELVKLSPDVIVAHTPPVIAAMRQASRLHSNCFCGSYRSRCPRFH